MTKFGIEVLLQETKWQSQLENKRLAFLGHSASVDSKLQNSLNLILQHTSLKFSCVLSPQHGFQNTEQANMITTENSYFHFSKNKIPLFSLYSSHTRRLTKEMLSCFDGIIIDLQDTGCRVYTYLTTLFYVLEDCCQAGKEVWILDRPNPAGRKVEGSVLDPNFMSFVGAGPLPMRHGLTLGEIALWYCALKKLDFLVQVIYMQNYQPEKNPWPNNFAWVCPSPNMVDEECTRCYTGTVLLEGTTISEARGTVFPLKAFGFPKMDTKLILKKMAQYAPHWMAGCQLREEFFKPMFDKFQNQVCSAIRLYATSPFYDSNLFYPYRLVSLFLKCVKETYSDFNIWQPPPYEYEEIKPPIDILSGDDFLRHWIEDTQAVVQDLENKLKKDELQWQAARKPFMVY